MTNEAPPNSDDPFTNDDDEMLSTLDPLIFLGLDALLSTNSSEDDMMMMAPNLSHNENRAHNLDENKISPLELELEQFESFTDTSITTSKQKSKSLTQNLHPDGLPWQFSEGQKQVQVDQGHQPNDAASSSLSSSLLRTDHQHSDINEESSNESLVKEFQNLARKLNIELTPSVLESLRRNYGQSHGSNQQDSCNDDSPSLPLSMAYDSSFNHAQVLVGGERNKRIKLELSTDGDDSVKCASEKSLPDISTSTDIAFVPKVQVMQEVAQATITAMSSRSLTLKSLPPQQNTMTFSSEINSNRDSSKLSTAESSLSLPTTCTQKRMDNQQSWTKVINIDDLNTNIKTNENNTTLSILTPSMRTGKNRKRVFTAMELNEKLASLQSENEILRRQVDIVTNKTAQFDNDRANAEQKMRRMMNDTNVSSEELNKLVMNHLEMYADYGSSRHEELTFHLDQLEKLAAPTSVTKMSLWTLGQNDTFFRNYKKRDSLSGILVQELGITSQQGKQIMVHRKTIQRLGTNIQASLCLLGKLKDLCLRKQQVFRDRMKKCQEILTPLQVVKLLLWVDNNNDTLNKVCPGWNSERIVAPKSAK